MVRRAKVVGRKQPLREGLMEVGKRLGEVFPNDRPWKGRRGKGVSTVEEQKTHDGELRVMRGRREADGGDAKLTWSKGNRHEVEAARAMWNKLKKDGFLGFRVKADASKGEVIDEFDENAEKLIMAPPLVGG